MSQISESSKTDGSVARIPSLAERFQSRKFILSSVAIGTATGLLIAGFINGDNWVSVAQFVTVGYVVGQAWQDRGAGL